MLESRSIYESTWKSRMDTRIIWMMIFITCNIGTSLGVTEDRNMTECYIGGVKCSRWSKCKFDTDKSNFTCTCVAGFKGDLCYEDRNECEIGMAPCKSRGVCHNSVGSFRCYCVPGWQGSHCQDSDGSGLNKCQTGYTGLNCTDDFDECTQWVENPCEHGSTCVNTPGNFTCYCKTGWGGRICNEDINNCSLTSGLCRNGGNCTNIRGSFKCQCPYPYTGKTCDDVSTTINTLTYSANSTRVGLAQSAPKEDYADDNDGTSMWAIIGPIVCILVIAGTVGAGLVVYNKKYRKAHKVDAGNETDVEKIKQ